MQPEVSRCMMHPLHRPFENCISDSPALLWVQCGWLLHLLAVPLREAQPPRYHACHRPALPHRHPHPLVSPVIAQTTVFSFCFTSQSLPNSPYGPWSVATGGQITVTGAAFNVTDTSAQNGGQRLGYTATGASVTRTQINRDGTTSTAQLNSLCQTGVQGSDNRLFQTAPSERR